MRTLGRNMAWLLKNLKRGDAVPRTADEPWRPMNFLPASGCGSGTSLNNAGLDGDYWSSVPLAGNSGDAKYLAAYSDNHGADDIYRFRGQPVRPVWPTRDLSAMTTDYTAEDGDVLTGTTTHGVSIPAGATVIINGVSVTGLGGGTVNPAPSFEAGGEAITTKFEQGAGGKWTLTTFAELGNDALGTDVEDGQIKVYAADTVEGLKSASPMADGVEVKEKKSAVKTTIEVTPPNPSAPAQFFRVGFGD